MKWNHLPEPGGLNAQDPDLLDGFQLIFHERSVYEEEERKKRERESKQASRKKPPRRGR